ncbi:MAG: hypothetical protein BWX64_02597 [Acidobacteria bacterium ADurb.Bin051]|nr:MAG: hypothetical protein BWX64_02597 [Acidobacteria bacterium ADurb.Bin051]
MALGRRRPVPYQEVAVARVPFGEVGWQRPAMRAAGGARPVRARSRDPGAVAYNPRL